MTVLRVGGWEFRPAFWPSVATIVMAGATAALGIWQTHRAEEKLALQRTFDERAGGAVLSLPSSLIDIAYYDHARVVVRGVFVPRHSLLLDNRILRGAVGYHVLTPLKITGGEVHVIVNRGWVAAGPRRDDIPKVPTLAGEVTLEGIAAVPSKRYYELGRETAGGPVVENLSLDRIRERTRLEIQPIVLQQTTDTPDGLVRVWQRPDTGVNTHRGYAVQWFALTVLTVVLYAAYNCRRIQG